MGAPSSTAAPMPSRRKRTPRRFSASKRRRSAGVSAKSSTSETPAQAFGGFEFETSESVIHVTRVDARMSVRDLMGALPELFGMFGKGALWRGEVVHEMLAGTRHAGQYRTVLKPPFSRGHRGHRVAGSPDERAISSTDRSRSRTISGQPCACG